MEKPPKKIERVETLSFGQKIALAKTLSALIDTRNAHIDRQGGFNTFAEAHHAGARSEYSQMENEIAAAVQEIDENVPDKKAFVAELEAAGERELAQLITARFDVPKDRRSLGSLFRRKN